MDDDTYVPVTSSIMTAYDERNILTARTWDEWEGRCQNEPSLWRQDLFQVVIKSFDIANSLGCFFPYTAVEVEYELTIMIAGLVDHGPALSASLADR